MGKMNKNEEINSTKIQKIKNKKIQVTILHNFQKIVWLSAHFICIRD